MTNKEFTFEIEQCSIDILCNQLILLFTVVFSIYICKLCKLPISKVVMLRIL